MRLKIYREIFVSILLISFMPLWLFGQTTLNLTDEVATYSSLTSTIVNITGQSELHLTSVNPLTNCTINLNSPDSWLFLEQVRPSQVISGYISQIKVSGSNAVNGNNVRVVQYVNGAVVIPHSSGFKPLTVYEGRFCEGNSLALGVYTYYKKPALGQLNDAVSSFTLKRGYMATFAQDEAGTGVSKVYIAQDSDLIVNVMPGELEDSVSFIRVFPWRWVNKKGWCGGDPVAFNALECSWYYNWDNAANSTIDTEYVPMRHGSTWPAYSVINSKTETTAVLAFNEPDSADQTNMTVDAAIEQWPNLLASGLRIGSPAPTDGGLNWLYEFIDRADELNYRVDYVAVHFYKCGWSASQLYNWLLEIHQRTGRPIWLTEFNNGANWTSCSDPTFDSNAITIQEFIDVMDNAPFVERYAIYNWVEDVRRVIWDDYWPTAAGINYRDNDAPLAYQQSTEEGTQGCAYYKFDDNTSDSLIYNNNATVTGNETYTTGINARAISLDGINDYITVPAKVTDCDDFTFAGWIYWNGGNQWQRIFDFGSSSTYYMLLTPRSGANTMRFAITTTSYNNEQRLETSQLTAGQWKHIAITIKNNTGKLFVNGELADTNQNMTINPSDLHPQTNYLGKSHFTTDPYFNGRLDEVRIANYALTDSEIQALYSGSAVNFAPGFTGQNIQAKPAKVAAAYHDNLLSYVGDCDLTSGSLTFSKISGPAWLNIATDGTISGTPELTDADLNSFQVQTKDQNNNTAQATLQIPVERYQIIAHYKFDNNLSDATGNNTLTSFGSPGFSTGKLQQAIVFDGVDDYIKLPAGISYHDKFMFAAWVYWNGGSQWQRIFDLGNGTTHYMLLTPRSGGNTLRLAITNSGNGNERRIDTAQLPAQQWVHLAVIVSGTTYQLYVNGQLAGTISNSGIPLPEIYANLSYLGKSQFASDPLFNGRMDDIRIYNYNIGSAAAQILPQGLSNNAPWFIRNPIPSIDAIEDKNYNGLNINYTARELDHDLLTYSKVSGPSWLAISPDGNISGTPTDADTGINQFTIAVTDSGGLSGTSSLSFEVKNIFSGKNGLEDFAGIALQWMNQNCTDTPACNGADLDGDNAVNINDLKVMTENWLAQ